MMSLQLTITTKQNSRLTYLLATGIDESDGRMNGCLADCTDNHLSCSFCTNKTLKFSSDGSSIDRYRIETESIDMRQIFTQKQQQQSGKIECIYQPAVPSDTDIMCRINEMKLQIIIFFIIHLYDEIYFIFICPAAVTAAVLLATI